MRRSLGVVAAGLVALAISGVGLSPAGAQDPEIGLGIREVDATDPAAVEVTFFYAGDRADLADIVVREGGRVVDTTSAVPLDDQQALGVVLVVDASLSMNRGALIERVREAAHAFVEDKAVTDQIAIVTFNGEVRLVQDFTTNEAVLSEALDSIALKEDTSLYDGIVLASSLFEDSTLQPNLVVFSDGQDNASAADRDRAEAAVTAVGGTLFAVGVENAGFDALAQIAEETGGSATIAEDPDGVGAIFEGVQSTLRKQYVFTYVSTATSGAVPIEITVGPDQASAEYVAGSSQEGAAALRPQVVEKPSGPAFFRTTAGFTLALALAAVAVVAFVFGLGTTFLGNENKLGAALRPYSEGFVAGPDSLEDDGDDGPRNQALAQTPLLQRAVEATGQFAERRGFLVKVEGMLERANLPLRPAEAIFFYAAGVVLLAVLLMAIAGSAFAGLIGAVIVALVPPSVLSFLASRRRKQFESLLPDTLQLLASTLRAGFSLMQGVEAVSQEVSEPMGRELRRVVTEARLGRPLEESLDGVAMRMDSGDFGWATMAIRIQREVGGNLAELLVTVADTMTERERLRRDVNALTAEGKVSAVVLGVMPLFLGLFIYAANPGYLDPLLEETVGKIMLVGSGILMGAGFYWMKKTIEIDI
jgi:tight adherence protein B